MRKLVKLEKKYDVTFNSKITEFLNPDYIYLPIKKDYDLLVKQNEDILKGQIVIENKLNKVKSSVSGKVMGTSFLNFNGKKEKCLVIENDFEEKEKFYTKKRLYSFNRENVTNSLYDHGLRYLASIFETKKIDNIIINGMEDEPYIENNPYILNKYSKQILETIDILINAFDIPNAYLTVKSNDSSNIDLYLNKIGTYPNINFTLVEDKYLLATPFFLTEYLNLNYEKSLVLTAKDILDIYSIIKLNKMVDKTFITISGPCIEKSQVLMVKIGSFYKDIIDKYIKINNDDSLFIFDGLMKGYESDCNKEVVTSSSKGIVIIPKENNKCEECNLCGLCYKICPVKVNPKKVMDKKKISTNCIDCGLCTYICPSRINLRKYLRGQNE